MLINALKNSFKNEGIENAFDVELRAFLREIDKGEVPSNFTSFYKNYLDESSTKLTDIKINNKILHQSKLINYFKSEGSSKKISKDLNEFLKKIKRKKNISFQKKTLF